MFLRKSEGRKIGETPGPGAYSTFTGDSARFQRTPQFGFGTAPRDSGRHGLGPGPGQDKRESPSGAAKMTVSY